MKFIAMLLLLIIGAYFGADHLLSTHLKSAAATQPEEKVLVQSMAKFLEQSPELQKKITDSGHEIKPGVASSPSPHPNAEVDLSTVARYFGSSPADQYFKKYLINKKTMNTDDPDEHTKVFVELSDYIHQHPKESIESLENALQSIPKDMAAERDALTPAFIHSAINYLEDQVPDDYAKKAYLKRFIDNTQDPEIKDALESHFPDLLNPTPAGQ